MAIGQKARNERLKRLFQVSELYYFKILRGADIAGQHPVIDRAADYWREKCGSDDCPRRTDIRPEDIRALLPHISLLDVLQDEAGFKLHTRLIGTHVSHYFGEITGRDIHDMENTDAAGRVYHMSSLAMVDRAPVLSRVRGFAPNKEHLEALALYCPLKAQQSDDIAMIMACVTVGFVSQSDISQT